MVFHLARLLHRTVAELERTMSAGEMLEWGRFLAIEAETEQGEHVQQANEKLLGQVLAFDAKLSGMQSMTRQQIKDLDL